MKDPTKFLVLFLCAATLAGAQRPSVSHLPNPRATQRSSSALDLVSGYREAASKLQDQTKVPLRLPTWVPYDDDKDNPVFATVDKAAPDSYEVELAWVSDCQGAGACHVGYISGSASPLPESGGAKIPVTLSGNVQGYFIDAACGANCDDSAVYWTGGGNHYSISMKAEKKDTLVKMANSAMGTASK
jgi:hypothetical protein